MDDQLPKNMPGWWYEEVAKKKAMEARGYRPGKSSNPSPTPTPGPTPWEGLYNQENAEKFQKSFKQTK